MEDQICHVLKLILAQPLESARNGLKTKRIFGETFRFPLNNKMPLLTINKVKINLVLAELMWYLNGHTMTQQCKSRVWDPYGERSALDATFPEYATGNLGPIYGYQWRHAGGTFDNEGKHSGGTDQLAELIHNIKHNPTSRRLMLVAYNAGDIHKMVLPPCLYSLQFNVSNNRLSCIATQRSSDIALAGGWNIASCAMLTHMLATVCDLTAHELIWNVGDIHCYESQLEAAEIMSNRTPRGFPSVHVTKPEGATLLEQLLNFKVENFEIKNYCPHDYIKVPYHP